MVYHTVDEIAYSIYIYIYIYIFQTKDYSLKIQNTDQLVHVFI